MIGHDVGGGGVRGGKKKAINRSQSVCEVRRLRFIQQRETQPVSEFFQVPLKLLTAVNLIFVVCSFSR